MTTMDRHPDGKKILALLDGELPATEAAAIREHCDACAGCARLLADHSAVRGMLQAREPARPLRPVWPAVRNRLARPGVPLFRPAFTMAATAAALLGVLLGVLVGSVGTRTVEPRGAYLWSVVSSHTGGDGGTTLQHIYSSSNSGEGR